ncbi:hypothetical protein [Sulfidibacter corallicola]|uniref:Uncharacterized protein n=1 Tax=Sulfidibacter corallicola TaxID=2818388 RepID=A0A8A4TTL6_SULCO|nr:hypothetical protein [Sulfidibacter corallicola]QTD52382.1 hypothetical protein J3U87_07905 [Sulfidibacter corallicola]
MSLVQSPKGWSREEVLNYDGIFFLKDIVKILGLDAAKVKRKAREIADSGGSPWERMGARKLWNHWVVRMRIFAPFYREHLVSKVKRPESEWDGNRLLHQRGLFYLTDVCKRIPFSAHQLRYQAKRRENPRREIGVFKDRELNTYLVDMEIFAPWINHIWEGRDQDQY